MNIYINYVRKHFFLKSALEWKKQFMIESYLHVFKILEKAFE